MKAEEFYKQRSNSIRELWALSQCCILFHNQTYVFKEEYAALCQPPVIGSVCTCKNAELEKDSLVPVYCHNCNVYVQTDL